MNILAEKLELIEWIAKLNDTSVIEKIKHIYSNNSKSADWGEELSNAEKVSIEKGLMDISNGNVQPHETVKKIYEKYL